MAVKNANAKSWSLAVQSDGNRYSRPSDGPGTTQPPAAPVLGTVVDRPGTLKRVPITTFPSGATSVSPEVSINGGTFVSAGPDVLSGGTYFEYDIGSATAAVFRARALNSAGYSAYSAVTTWPLADLEVTGSGFGNTTTLLPIFYDFFEVSTITDGANVTSRGYLCEWPMSLRTVDGPTAGAGCAEGVSTSGWPDFFPHFRRVLTVPRKRIFATWKHKLERISGTAGTGAFQMKGPRFSYQVEYSGLPRVTSSYYHQRDLSVMTHAHMSHVSSYEDIGGDDAGVTPPSNYRASYRPNGWNLSEMDIDFGDVGTANGYWHHWYNGLPLHPFRSDAVTDGSISENIRMRSTSAQGMDIMSIFPGIDAITAPDVYRLRFSDIWINDTPRRLVLGDAPTWAACRQKVICLPNSWADGSVKGKMRKMPGVAAGGQVWGYVVNDAGVVSNGGNGQLKVAI